MEPDPGIQWKMKSYVSVFVPCHPPAVVTEEKGKADNLYVEE